MYKALLDFLNASLYARDIARLKISQSARSESVGNSSLSRFDNRFLRIPQEETNVVLTVCDHCENLILVIDHHDEINAFPGRSRGCLRRDGGRQCFFAEHVAVLVLRDGRRLPSEHQSLLFWPRNGRILPVQSHHERGMFGERNLLRSTHLGGRLAGLCRPIDAGFDREELRFR